MLMVSPVRALALHAWMGSGHWRCHKNCRSLEYPLAAWDEESKYAIVDGSLGMMWEIDQCLETKLLSRIDMMRFMKLLRCL